MKILANFFYSDSSTCMVFIYAWFQLCIGSAMHGSAIKKVIYKIIRFKKKLKMYNISIYYLYNRYINPLGMWMHDYIDFLNLPMFWHFLNIALSIINKNSILWPFPLSILPFKSVIHLKSLMLCGVSMVMWSTIIFKSLHTCVHSSAYCVNSAVWGATLPFFSLLTKHPGPTANIEQAIWAGRG